MIIVAGEALMDLTPAQIGEVAGYVPHPGGSPYNVAVGLGRLGVQVAFAGRISTDHFGRTLRDHLAESRVVLDHVAKADDPSTVAFVHLGDGEPEYSFYAEGTADRMLTPAHLGHLPTGAGLHVGSISLVLEPSASTLEGLLRQESRRRLISLDPNVRAGLIDDPPAYRARFSDWVELVDVLKLSAADLAWLVPGRAVDEAIAAWLAAGVVLVLLTDGANGASAHTAGASAQVPSPQVAVTDTVGAGDAFTAGALAHLHDQGWHTRDHVTERSPHDLRALLTNANAVAADTCTRSGAEPPWR